VSDPRAAYADEEEEPTGGELGLGAALRSLADPEALGCCS
jgi:hypothetical protein